jgi:hypothetical protein
MSWWDAADFVRETEGRLCVRFYRRRDGTLLTEDCPVGWRAARRRLLRWGGSSLAVAFGPFGVKPPAIEQYSETMGLAGEPGPITQEYASAPQLGLSVVVLVGAIVAIIRGRRADAQATSPIGRESSPRGAKAP